MTIEERAHTWAVNNKNAFPVDLEYIEFFYYKGLRKGVILAIQEIQKRIMNTEDDTALMELQKMVKSIADLLIPSFDPEQ